MGQWSTNDVYSYGFLIPWISLYIVWRRRGRLAKAHSTPAPVVGAIVLAAGLGMLIAGRLVAIVGIQEFSIVVSIVGLVLLTMGQAALRVLWFPTAYLFFMMPIWDVVTERLQYPFQLVAAGLGGWVLGRLGIPVHREPTLLVLPNITLEVARACSGVNYLIAVAAVGVPLAYVSFRDQGRRVALIVFAILIAVLANPLRVALIGLLSYYGMSVNVHGPWHVLQGLSVAMSGYAALFFGVWLLSKLSSKSEGAAEQSRFAAESPPLSMRRTQPVRPAWPLAVAASLALIGTGVWRPAGLSEPTPPPLGAERIPLEIGAWKGRENRSPLVPGSAGPARPEDLWRVYQAPSGEVVQLYVGRYGRPDPRGTVSFWGDAVDPGAARKSIELPSRSPIEINHAVLRSGSRETQVLYWYDLGGHTGVSRIEAKLVYAWRTLSGSGRGPVVVVLVSNPSDAFDRSRVLTEMSAFVRELLPFLDGSLGG
jgi:EpsI family protein